jgi:hypothetical protein
MKIHVAVIRQPNITAPIAVTYDDGRAAELVEADPYCYRTGLSLGRTVYAQLGEVPSRDDDLLVGTMETPYMADLVVGLLNRHLNETR